MNSQVTYEPDNSLKRGYGHMLVDVLGELYANRWLTYQLFRRDIMTIYKQSLFGVLWVLITPLASIGTFVVLNRSGVFNIGELTTPYVIFALLGTIYWQIFAVGIVGCSNSLVNAGGMLSKINFSKKSLVLAATGQPLIVFIIQYVLLIILFVVYQVNPHAIIFAAPLFAIPVFLFTLGLGFVMALLNAVVRDISNVLPLLTTFLMFLTPILYVIPQSGTLARITEHNPLYFLSKVPRDLILTGSSPDMHGYWVSCLVAVLVFGLGLFIFHITETRITEKV